MKSAIFRVLIRRLSTAARAVEARQAVVAGKMSAWQIHGYGEISELQETTARIPHINAPDEVLVKVDAASVNPIDVAMIKGYGATVFNTLRRSDVEFPLTLGRDFSGTVEWLGPTVTDVELGQRVWGVLPPHWQGSHAQYTVAKRDWVSPQPSCLSNVEAASVLYAGLTAWSALWLSGGLSVRGARGKRVLVLGAAGGVGALAVQMLRAADAFVICSCSTDAVPLVQGLGADMIFDRKHADYNKCLAEHGPYDIILDCAGLGAAEATQHDWKFGSYVTLTTPLLRDTDSHGLVSGTLGSGVKLLCQNVRTLSKGSTVRWAYFVPSQKGISHLQKLVESNKLRPVIGEVYGWDQLPQGFKRVQEGHLRGKVVIDFSKHSGDVCETSQ